jgi:tetratricopeptide (TPR) repeat protein
MKTLLRYWLLVCLVVPCGRLSAQTRNPYDLQLHQLQARWSSAGALEKLVLLDQTFRLRDYVDDRSQIVTVFASVINAKGESQIVHQEASALSAELSGRTDSAAQRWYVAGNSREQVLSEALQTTRSSPTAESYGILAELEWIAGSPEAAEHMQRAAQLSPSAPRWQRVAVITSDPFQKFAALQSGLTLAPADSQLSLQLANYYIGRNQLEQARDLLTRALVASPNDFVVRERLATLYLSLGLRSQALRDLKELQRQWPHPLWLKARLALDYEQLGLRDEAAALAQSVLSQDSNTLPMLELLVRFHQSRHMERELESDYLALSALQPQSADTWRALARVQLNSGDLTGARASLLRLIELRPDDANAHRLLATTYQSLHMQSSADAEMAAAERARLKIVRPDGDSEFLQDSSALVQSARLQPPQSPDTALADIRIQELYPTGLDRLHVQQIFYVGSDAAADAHRLTEIAYAPSSDALRVIHARDWKPDGQVLEAEDLGDRQPSDSSQSMFYDSRARQLRFARLTPGDVLEIEYALTPVLRASPYGHYFGEMVSFAAPTPTSLKRYVLIAPAAEPIYSHAEKLPQPRVLLRDGARITIWESHQLPAMVREPQSPGITELAPYLHVSTFADWQQLGAWYADLVRPQFALDDALQQKLLSLLKGKQTDKQKIAAIQDFVLGSTHYIAQEFGVYSYKPYPVSQIYARRFGDCKDKASLMIALLRAAGIEARLALVRTRSLGVVAPRPASMAVFDHAIVYIPKYDLWLDGTAEFAVRELPLQDQGALALVIGLDGTSQLRHTPLSRASDNYTRHIIQAQLSREGAVRFSGSTTARGEDAPGLRQELSVRDQQLDTWRRDLAQVFPSVRVYSLSVRDQKWPIESHEPQAAGEINVDFRGGFNPLVLKRIVTLGSSWIPRQYTEVLAASSTRTQDLILFAPWTTEEEIHVALPSGARVLQLPHDKTVSTPFGSMRLHYRKLAGAVVVQSKVEFDKARVAVAEYLEFRQFCLQMERSFREEITVELPE